MPLSKPVHPLPVVGLQRLPIPFLELFVPGGQTVAQAVQHLLPVVFAAGFEAHRRRVRQRRIEPDLIDVHSNPDDRTRQAVARQVVFDQNADQLAVARIDVVRPFDPGVDAITAEKVRQSQSHRFRKQKLFRNGQKTGFPHQREHQVASLLAAPGMPPLAASGALPLGADRIAVSVARIPGLVVGRGRLFEKMIAGPVHPKGIIPKLRNPGALR